MFKNTIEDKLYRQLNQDRSIKHFFRSDSVGKCMKLIDDYYKIDKNFTKEGWVEYYLSQKPKEKLLEISEAISEKTSQDLNIIKQYVFFRVIGQTYNGFLEELNVIKELQNEFKDLDFIKGTYELDEKYFTDFECYFFGDLLFGIQVKPITYKLMNKDYQLKAKENHQKQRAQYQFMFNVPHRIIYYNENKIHEPEQVFEWINLNLMKTIL